MEDKDKEIKKPILDAIPTDLEDLGEEEVAQAFEGLKVGAGGAGAPHSIMPDPKMEAEIKEMFQEIVSQYITPIGKSIKSIANGDISERNLDICIGALKPLILACEEIHYNDIYDVLKSIEQPLVAFREGKKRLLSKKDLRNITTDYKELTRLISRSVGSDMVETSPTGTVRIATVNTGTVINKSPEEMQIADALAYFDDVDHKDIQKLYAGGLIKLGLLSQATAQEISESTGVEPENAEKLKECAIKALASISAKKPISVKNVPLDEVPSLAKSEAIEEQFDFDEDEENNTQVSYKRTPKETKNRWLSAVEAITSESSNYLQAANNLINELERTHRALVRARVAREKFKGEVEFYQDDLLEMMQSDEHLSQELGNPLNAQRLLLKRLQQVIDSLNSSMNKTDKLYSQMDEMMGDLQDVEAQFIALRRHRPNKGSSLLHRRNSEKSREIEIQPTDE
jgi:hypothetical protein